MKTMSKEQALAIVLKDERKEPPEIPPANAYRQQAEVTVDDVVRPANSLTVRGRVRKLLEEDKDLAIWFQVLCESGPEAIKAQAWQVAQELHRDEGEIRDAMLELAHELLPDSPSGEDPKRVLFREYLLWTEQQNAIVRDRLAGDPEDGFEEAWESLGDFRHWLRARCRAALEVAA